jgi:hypothetical protein
VPEGNVGTFGAGTGASGAAGAKGMLGAAIGPALFDCAKVACAETADNAIRTTRVRGARFGMGWLRGGTAKKEMEKRAKAGGLPVHARRSVIAPHQDAGYRHFTVHLIVVVVTVGAT